MRTRRRGTRAPPYGAGALSARRGRRPRRPVSAAPPRCHSEPVTVSLAWESVSPHLPLRGRCQREALTEGERPRAFLSPSRLRRQPPPRGGLTALPRSPAALRPPTPHPTVKITTIRRQILCTYPKYGNFAGNGCAGGGGVLYSDRQSHTRAAPMGAGFFSYLYIFRKRITGRLRNKF